MVPLGRQAQRDPLDRKDLPDLREQLAPKATREIEGSKAPREIALSAPKANQGRKATVDWTAHLALKARKAMSARLDSPDPQARWGLADFKDFAVIWGHRGAMALQASKAQQANAARKGFKASLDSVATLARKARRVRFPKDR